MISYILNTCLFQLIFLIIYDVWLRKETFFNWNRFYLLITASLSLVLPLLRFESLALTLPKEYSIQLPTINIGGGNASQATLITNSKFPNESAILWTWNTWIYLGMAIAAIIFLIKLLKIFKVYKESLKSTQYSCQLALIPKSTDAFSFFKIIFIGENLKQSHKESIIRHELVHVTEKHSYDFIFFELLRIIFWMNPLIYLYQSRIEEQHEFIADSKCIKPNAKSDYYKELLNQVFKYDLSLVNHFNKQSLIKKRIVMLSKTKSNSNNVYKYGLIIPVIIGMLFYVSCEQDNLESSNESKSLTSKISEIKNSLESGDKISLEEAEALEGLYVELIKKREQMKVDNNNKDNANHKERNETLVVEGFSAEEVPYILLNEVIDGKNVVDQQIEVPYAAIEKVPLFEGCTRTNSNNENQKCTSDKIADFVSKNFNTKIGKEFGLVGRQRINVIFKIDENGNVVGVRSRAPIKALEEEAMRVISLLPKFTPGMQKGKNVIVPYSLPIVFEVSE
ncbi:Signal transducer regulating beta-lactamase production, contains metallopeptidase domain [Flavobacteriaceae bacterium MAR_2010_188]|nr:Signal transducer regulating beta-lactamase production, contains metallopeptidase domain [Flavobacteriaceae bacterium MAR_2010_188]